MRMTEPVERIPATQPIIPTSRWTHKIIRRTLLSSRIERNVRIRRASQGQSRRVIVMWRDHIASLPEGE